MLIGLGGKWAGAGGEGALDAGLPVPPPSEAPWVERGSVLQALPGGMRGSVQRAVLVKGTDFSLSAESGSPAPCGHDPTPRPVMGLCLDWPQLQPGM